MGADGKPTEECDDGQETPNCTKDCRVSVCGDGYPNKSLKPDGKVAEECDDGQETTICTKGCKVSSCGDGYINKALKSDGKPSEECDDGPNGSATCTAQCTVSFCGDGKTNSLAVPKEDCDPGAPGAETAICNKDCTLSQCGDGKLNKALRPDGSAEQCDDGPNGSATCTVKCTVSACGDAVVNSLTVPPEECDPGAPGAMTHQCNDNCTTASCGDGKVNPNHLVATSGGSHPEQCDPGAAGETANCNSDCTFASCGDGVVNKHTVPPEACDPGSPGVDTALCNKDCTVARCGDGYVNHELGEECDEGTETANCNGPAAGAVACHFAKCHDGYTNGLAGENCDPGGTDLTESSTCNNDCTTSRCHDGKKNVAAGEACDPGGTSTTETFDCNNDCTAQRCGDFKLNKAAGEQCDAPINCNDCKSADCGDDIVNPAVGEECDPGAAGETPTCTSSCKISKCGDGYPNHALVALTVTCTSAPCDTGDTCVGGLCYRPAETCDLGQPGKEDATCNSDCTSAACGDGTLNRANGEQCDDKLCEDHLKACKGDSDCRGIGAGACLSGSATCNGTAANALACKTSYCGDSYTNALASEDCDPGPFFESDACNSDCTLAQCGDGKVNRKHALAGGGFEECDPGGSASVDPTKTFQTADCNFDCTASRCGDFKKNLDANEECDDGPLGSTTCTTDCKLSKCGDGKVNPKAGEECDEGTATPSALCNNNAAGAISANVQCKLTRCGDGWRNTAKEACDPGAGLIESPSCNSDCTSHQCGDSKLNVAAGEQCDDGATGSSKCNGNDSLAIAAGVQCKFARCGDAYTNAKTSPVEQCDTGGESTNCNRDCTTASCGDGKINLARLEQCDDGSAGSATCNRPGAVKASNPTVKVECLISKCGDDYANTVGSAEACDPGPTGESNGCNRDCTAATCGDGKVNLTRGEQCDDGAGGSATCNRPGAVKAANPTVKVECLISKCGDDYANTVGSAEACDPGPTGESTGCNRDCTAATCGDGKVNLTRGEQCDDGAGGSATCNRPGAVKASNPTVKVECLISKCGDDYANTVGSAEACDPGPTGEATGCNRDCTVASCGDNKINVTRGEQCDVGVNGSAACNKKGALTGGGTNVECRFSSCGDAYTNGLAGETCDNGTSNNGNDKDCLANCLVASCGDGYLETNGTAPHETCDQGTDNDRTTCPYGSVSCTSCRSNCTQLITINGAYCGDGIAQTGESCDSGNSLGCGLCSADCQDVLSAAAAKGYVTFPDRWELDGQHAADPRRRHQRTGGLPARPERLHLGRRAARQGGHLRQLRRQGQRDCREAGDGDGHGLRPPPPEGDCEQQRGDRRERLDRQVWQPAHVDHRHRRPPLQRPRQRRHPQGRGRLQLLGGRGLRGQPRLLPRDGLRLEHLH
ncbi:MAG: hypothetical protein QM765_48305 [Myxococcales bacterium]